MKIFLSLIAVATVAFSTTASATPDISAVLKVEFMCELPLGVKTCRPVANRQMHNSMHF